MRTKTVNLVVYDIGDILDIKNLNKTNNVKQSLYNGKRAIVLDVNERKNGTFSYKVLVDNGTVHILKPEEMGNEKYIDHIDMMKFFADTEG